MDRLKRVCFGAIQLIVPIEKQNQNVVRKSPLSLLLAIGSLVYTPLVLTAGRWITDPVEPRFRFVTGKGNPPDPNHRLESALSEELPDGLTFCVRSRCECNLEHVA